MGILEIVGLILSIIATVAPTILAHMGEKRKERKHDTDALVTRDRDELRAGLERLRKTQGL